jgi:hypothetical protein
LDSELKELTQQPHPMFKASNIHYGFDGRHQGISWGYAPLIISLAGQIPDTAADPFY